MLTAVSGALAPVSGGSTAVAALGVVPSFGKGR